MTPSYILVRAVVWAYGGGQQTDRQTHRPLYILRRLRLTQNATTTMLSSQLIQTTPFFIASYQSSLLTTNISRSGKYSLCLTV